MVGYMKCRYCEHEWTKRVKTPVECPRCKRHLDSPFKHRIPSSMTAKKMRWKNDKHKRSNKGSGTA